MKRACGRACVMGVLRGLRGARRGSWLQRVHMCLRASMRVCAVPPCGRECVCVRVCACLRACVRASVGASVRACA